MFGAFASGLTLGEGILSVSMSGRDITEGILGIEGIVGRDAIEGIEGIVLASHDVSLFHHSQQFLQYVHVLQVHSHELQYSHEHTLQQMSQQGSKQGKHCMSISHTLAFDGGVIDTSMTVRSNAFFMRVILFFITDYVACYIAWIWNE